MGSATVEAPAPTAIPISDDFESYAIDVTTFTNFQNDANEALVWEVNSGGTTTTATGPTGDVSGIGNYIYMETSS